eukprot:TRINITY_DN4735_c0_g1_i1.p1 TRINITY_DN4735_c0_g1~~TRINITY_DN4735_c0_g1_i1.p1  ORF type:complete len:151 (-),score=22.42 TRINITY_DN4735_c0_g1_i1:75-467(-)
MCSHTSYGNDKRVAKALVDAIFDYLASRVEGEEALCYDLRNLKKNFPPPKSYRVTEDKHFQVTVTAVKFKSQIGKNLTFKAWITYDDQKGKYIVDSMARTTEYGPEKCHPQLHNPNAKEYCACKDTHNFF